MDKPYVVVESRIKGIDAIKLTKEPWEGIIYTYGKVELDEDEANSTVHLKFDYEVLDWNSKSLTNKQPFEIFIGQILEELIHEGIEQNSLTYTGGVDENRNEDSE